MLQAMNCHNSSSFCASPHWSLPRGKQSLTHQELERSINFPKINQKGIWYFWVLFCAVILRKVFSEQYICHLWKSCECLYCCFSLQFNPIQAYKFLFEFGFITCLLVSIFFCKDWNCIADTGTETWGSSPSLVISYA